jgi:hypothetical protein
MNNKKNTAITQEQKRKFESLKYLYEENQINYDEYKNGALSIFPEEDIVETYVNTELYPGHTIKQLHIRNYDHHINEYQIGDVQVENNFTKFVEVYSVIENALEVILAITIVTGKKPFIDRNNPEFVLWFVGEGQTLKDGLIELYVNFFTKEIFTDISNFVLDDKIRYAIIGIGLEHGFNVEEVF